jgi:hypothetical protein
VLHSIRGCDRPDANAKKKRKEKKRKEKKKR